MKDTHVDAKCFSLVVMTISPDFCDLKKPVFLYSMSKKGPFGFHKGYVLENTVNISNLPKGIQK